MLRCSARWSSCTASREWKPLRDSSSSSVDLLVGASKPKSSRTAEYGTGPPSGVKTNISGAHSGATTGFAPVQSGAVPQAVSSCSRMNSPGRLPAWVPSTPCTGASRHSKRSTFSPGNWGPRALPFRISVSLGRAK